MKLFSSLLDQIYSVQVSSHLTALSPCEVAPPMNFPYHTHSGRSHIYLTNPLSSGILQFQSEIVADPKKEKFLLKKKHKIFYVRMTVHLL